MPRDPLTRSERAVLGHMHARKQLVLTAGSVTRVVNIANAFSYSRAAACAFLKSLVRKGYAKQLKDRSYAPVGRMPR